ncbi:MAG TPA: G1 family glutamic endopeptidase [Acidimicrobiales bacterium]|nr:G1 family glutamic endopeptidase [Acidimicrobiales bacterium]
MNPIQRSLSVAAGTASLAAAVAAPTLLANDYAVAAPTSCAPITISASATNTANGDEAIGVSGCGYAGTGIEIIAYAGGEEIAQVTTTTTPTIPAVTVPPHCMLSVRGTNRCRVIKAAVIGGALAAILDVPPGCYQNGNLRVIGYQGPSQSNAVVVPDTVNKAASGVTAGCLTATSTNLAIPSVVTTAWTSVNPATVSTGTKLVSSGSISITVNGALYCTYPAGATTGCPLALPAGDDKVVATYSGGTLPPAQLAPPWYAPSSTQATVTVTDPTNSTSSSSWAGYVVTGETYDYVYGSWTVPKAACGNFPTGDLASSSSTWVGIDGWNENTVEQIGTDSNCATWTGVYWAWFEMYPNLPEVISNPLNNTDQISPGDVMDASVQYTGNPGWYRLYIQDVTKNWSFATTQYISGATGGTAEWVTEQPADGGLPLTDFGSVTFTGCYADGSNAAAYGDPIWQHANTAVEMEANGTEKASVSALSANGSQFTVTWRHG